MDSETALEWHAPVSHVIWENGISAIPMAASNGTILARCQKEFARITVADLATVCEPARPVRTGRTITPPRRRKPKTGKKAAEKRSGT